jgi:TP901 family phage tail tape measure protein
MASASGIRLGKVFVEIGADPSKLFGALNKLNKRIGSIGSSMANFGGRMTALGAGLAAPIGLAIRAGTSFESVLKNISASTGATAGDIGRINAAAMQLSESMGTGPTAIAQGFLELLKAGMPLEAVLSGAGKAALEFAKVGELSVAEAAVVMSDAMNVFGVDAANAANTMSAAADASSTSIQEIAMAFTQVSAVAAQSNQGIDDVAAALALMANAGVKGSDAGTSLKNMFAKLKSPVDAAATALGSIGLSTESFRDASGAMLPLAQQIEVLRNATAGLDQATKDDVFQRVFGTDAIRAALILTEAGAAGIDGMKNSMADALPVSEKYRQLQSGLAGVGEALMGSLERLAVAITEALGPSLLEAGKFLKNVVTGLTAFVKQNGDAVVSFAQTSAGILAFGAALIAAGKALTLLSSVMAIVLSPLGLVAAGVALIAVKSGFAEEAIDGLQQTAEGVGSKISEALGSGDFEKAWIYAIAAVEEALLRMRAAFERAIQRPINLAAVRLAETGATSSLRQRLFEMTKGANAGGFKDARRSFEALQTASTADEFDSARAAAMKSAQEARGRGQEDPARALEEMVELVKQRLTQVGVLGDNALESGLADITARAEGKIASLEAKRAERDAAEASRPQAGEMGPAIAGGAVALSNPSGGLSAPPWLQAMMDDERNRRDAEERARKLAEEQQSALASQSEAVGTFSSVGISGMGFGSNLQQRIADAAAETAKNTAEMVKQGKGEVGE